MINTVNILKRLFEAAFTFLIISSNSVFAQNQDSMIRVMKSGNYQPDTSFIYQIPFKPDKKIRLVQGYHGIFSHSHEYSSDFGAKKGTTVCAARSGVVIKTKSDSKVGGLGRKFLSKGNHIIIKHSDSTYAAYWHLQYAGTKVKVGDSVSVGQIIGLSGNTGYSAFPHLHFMVYKYDNSERRTMPIRFKTQRGICYLKPGRRYCRPKSGSMFTDN